MRHDQESLAGQPSGLPGSGTATRLDADYVFYELTRSIWPQCRRPIDAQIVLRDSNVFLRQRCPEHGQFEALVDAGDLRARRCAFPCKQALPQERGYTLIIARRESDAE